MGQTSEHQGAWYAVRSATCLEKRAMASIAQAGVKAYMPCRRNWSWHAGSKHKVERPLMSGYLFVWIEKDEEFHRVGIADGVHAFVKGTAGRHAVIPTAWVELIMRAERMALFDHTVPRKRRRLEIGDRVKITGTSFAGRLAAVVELIKDTDKQGNEKVRSARVDLGGWGKMKVNIDQLERAA